MGSVYFFDIYNCNNNNVNNNNNYNSNNNQNFSKNNHNKKIKNTAAFSTEDFFLFFSIFF